MALFRKRKKLDKKVRQRDIPDGLWMKCPSCSEIVFKQELAETFHICPKCDHHFQLSRDERLKLLADEGWVEEWDTNLRSLDVLGFTGADSYVSKLETNITKTGHNDAISTGLIKMDGHDVSLGIMDFSFLGASMGSVVGEKITRLIEKSTKNRLPVIISCASGGARMYEGMLSLMQMAKTSAALARHSDEGLLYIALLTHPTMAGVMASFATLGDVIIAEPGALIGFAGPRVIKETTQADLPEGFQRAEFLLEHGLLDAIVSRKELKKTLVHLIEYMTPKAEAAPAAATTTS